MQSQALLNSGLMRQLLQLALENNSNNESSSLPQSQHYFHHAIWSLCVAYPKTVGKYVSPYPGMARLVRSYNVRLLALMVGVPSLAAYFSPIHWMVDLQPWGEISTVLSTLQAPLLPILSEPSTSTTTMDVGTLKRLQPAQPHNNINSCWSISSSSNNIYSRNSRHGGRGKLHQTAL
jgi:hypothetical protein